MEESYKVLLENIRRAEGGKLHYNKGETDITTGYGIYKAVHPNASIFIYIDNLANELGITKPSREWDITTIEKINKKINFDIELGLSYEFYKEYLAPLELESIHSIVVPTVYNLYTNGVLLCVTSIQNALNALSRRHPDLYNGYLNLKVDGVLGNVTRGYYKHLLDKGYSINREFGDLILLYAKSFYINLALKNDKYLKYLKGWNNRVDNLV